MTTALGRLIRSKREELGLTLNEASYACRTSWGTLNDVEIGAVREPRRKTLERIQQGLGISDDELRECGFAIPEGLPVPIEELPPALAAMAERVEAARPDAVPVASTGVPDMQQWCDYGAAAVLASAMEQVEAGTAGPAQHWAPELASRLQQYLGLAGQVERLLAPLA